MLWPRPGFPMEAVSMPRVQSGAYDRTIVTADSTVHTKGAYAEIIAETAADTFWLNMVWVATRAANLDSSMLLDLAIGAAASEKIIIPDLGVGFADLIGAGNGLGHLSIPFYIPAGSRISARCQAAITVDQVQVAIDLLGGPSFEGGMLYTAADAYGASLSTSHGVVPQSGTSGAKGSWVEIVDETTDRIDALAVCVQGEDGSMSGRQWSTDIGVGGAGSEVVVLPEFVTLVSSTEHMYSGQGNAVFPLGVSIPEGSRLAVRTSSSSNNVTDIAVHVLGFRR